MLVRLKHGHDVCNHIEQALRTGLDPEHGRAEQDALRLSFWRLDSTPRNQEVLT